MLLEPYIKADVESALWAIGNEKSPGPDEYGRKIFRDSWETAGKDFVAGVLELKRILPTIIADNQSAFVAGRSIVQNVLISQDLVRLMKWVTGLPGFEYHAKCKGLRLNHLCIADDMLMFSKGTVSSVVLMLRAFKRFSKASGLTTNADKLNIFIANMENSDVVDLCELTGYKKGRLPFRYLGVPTNAKKLSVVDCEMLWRKWASVHYKAPLVAWDVVCQPKKTSGLGATDCIVWNEATIAKYVWNIANKVDNLWVKWVNHVYLKGEDWWQYSPPQNSC
ncbi:uncharacterized protein LOC132034887 [Lycium ferocissimum]|uniref:uncharacterized protein LOC132034887 n=1 Tax=Lycium ferocissimum TaxID=112874 RepID=UPI0028155537|nr:uncharacterized protein LOC132034887 [Lycium ferocissimum]